MGDNLGNTMYAGLSSMEEKKSINAVTNKIVLYV